MIVRSNLLITGYAGTPHVTAAQQGACNAGMYGSGKYVFDTGNQFAYEIISNNLIKVRDGYAMNQGRLMGIDNTLYEELIIDNGLQGVKRVDLICMKYTKNAETGIENVEMVVVKGTSGDNYIDPSIVSGDILAGAAEDDFPLYRVKIDGINIVAVEPLFHIMVPAKKIMDKLGTTDISTIGDGTATGAISAINNNLTKIFLGNGVSQLQVFLDYPENQYDVFHIRLSDDIGRVHAVRLDQSTIEYAIYFPDTDEWKSIWVK